MSTKLLAEEDLTPPTAPTARVEHRVAIRRTVKNIGNCLTPLRARNSVAEA
jgi:hypothetical protein